jgi:poly(beta-D-mannuronate) lyase
MPAYERPSRTDNRNNHAYWAGLAVAAAGVATDDRALLEWGVDRYRRGVAEIAEDGALPLEMARRSRALHYHLFALAPLVMLAEIGEANGLPLYRERDGALHRLVGRVVAGLADPSGFAAAARADQETPRLAGESAGWIEPYAARFADPAVRRLAAAARPIRSPRLGGDLTLAFAAPRP